MTQISNQGDDMKDYQETALEKLPERDKDELKWCIKELCGVKSVGEIAAWEILAQLAVFYASKDKREWNRMSYLAKKLEESNDKD